MININIRALQASDKEIIDFIKERLSLRWGPTAQEIENNYILPSFAGSFPYIFIAVTETGKFVGKALICLEEKGFLNITGQPWLTALFVEEKKKISK